MLKDGQVCKYKDKVIPKKVFQTVPKGSNSIVKGAIRKLKQTHCHNLSFFVEQCNLGILINMYILLHRRHKILKSLGEHKKCWEALF